MRSHEFSCLADIKINHWTIIFDRMLGIEPKSLVSYNCIQCTYITYIHIISYKVTLYNFLYMRMMRVWPTLGFKINPPNCTSLKHVYFAHRSSWVLTVFEVQYFKHHSEIFLVPPFLILDITVHQHRYTRKSVYNVHCTESQLVSKVKLGTFWRNKN